MWRALWLLGNIMLGGALVVHGDDDSSDFDILNPFIIRDSERYILTSRDNDFNFQNAIQHFIIVDQLNCNFGYNACGWTQKSTSQSSWHYSYNDRAITFSHKNGGHAPSLTSPNIDQSLFGYCFTFDYRLENVALDIQLHLKDTNSIHQLQKLNHNGDGHLVVNIDVISDVKELVISPRVSNTTDNFAKLSDFKVKMSGACGYSHIYNSQVIREANGEVIVLRSNQIKECTWIGFNGTFSVIPDILLETKYDNIRATIDYRTTTGFEVCAFATTYMPFLSVRLSWRASENATMICDLRAEYRCQSGECIHRDTICNAYRDCLSGDDETSSVCAAAMSQLAFATFSTTVMLTYLVTYMKYIKDIRIMILGDRLNEESRLEEINLREIQRENQ